MKSVLIRVNPGFKISSIIPVLVFVFLFAMSLNPWFSDLANMDAIAAAYNYYASTNITAGDVVIWDTTTAYAVKTTTTQGSQDVAGVATETVSAGATCAIRQDGGRVIVNVTSASKGQWLITSTTTGKAVGVDAKQEGVFAKAITDAGAPAAGQCYASVNLGFLGYGSSSGAPAGATYITQTPHDDLNNEQALNALDDGLLKHASGVLAKAVPGTDYAEATLNDPTFITQTPSAELDNEQALNALDDGLLKHASGVVAKAVPGTDYAEATLNDPTFITQTPSAELDNEQALNALDDGLLKHASGVVAKATAGADYAAASIYTVTDWGVAGDGVTDDTTAIQYVINTVDTLGGGPVYFPAGTYLISDTLDLPSLVTLEGQGHGVSIIKLDDSSNCAMLKSENFDSLTGQDKWLTSAGVAYGFGLENLTFDANKAGQSGGTAAIMIYGKRYRIKNVMILNAYGIGLYSETGDATGQTDWTDMPTTDIGPLWIKNPGSHGLQYRGPHDGYIHHLDIGNAIGGYGARFEKDGSTYNGACDVNFATIYGAANKGLYIDTDVRIQAATVSDSGEENLYITSNSIGSELGKLFLSRADTGDSSTYYNAYIGGSYTQIAELRVSDTNASAGGVNVAGIHTSIQNINVYSDGQAGTGLRVGANNTSAAGRIVGYSGSGGKGVETGAGAARSGCVVSLHINNCDTGWVDSNIGSRNIYTGSIYATAAQEILSGQGPANSSGANVWLVNGSVVDDAAEGKWYDSVLTLKTIQAILDVYVNRMLIGSEITPPANNPDANTMWLYPQDLSGVSRWYSKDAAGTQALLAYPGELLSGTDPDVSQKGDISQDTDDAVIRAYDDGKQKGIVLDPQFSFIVLDPENVPDHSGRATKSFPVVQNTTSLVYKIDYLYSVADEDNYTFKLFESGGPHDWGTANDSQIDEVVCETDGTSGYYKEIDTGFDDDDIAPGRWLIYEHSSGTAGNVAITVKGHYDADVD